jgi:hypothetical protein
MSLSIIALITWIIAAGCGLYLVSIWLIEYDKDFQAAARTRLPPAVLVAHVSLAGGGLVAWAVWFVWWTNDLVWAAAAALSLAATLGTVMAIRWVGVYREKLAVRRAAEQETASLVDAASQRAGSRPAGASSQRVATPPRQVPIGPPERNFPLPVVIAHGVFAVATLTMVLLIAFGAVAG